MDEMSRKKKKRVSLANEDRARLRRLSEEIDGRAAELSRILARQLEAAVSWPVVEYRLTMQPATAADVVVVMHEVTFTDGSKLCHDGEKRITCEGPCPC